MGNQKNHLFEHPKQMLKWWARKYSEFYTFFLILISVYFQLCLIIKCFGYILYIGLDMI